MSISSVGGALRRTFVMIGEIKLMCPIKDEICEGTKERGQAK
jgi:hypothetical protein